MNYYIGLNISYLCDVNRLKQKEFAELFSLKQTAISSYINEGVAPKLQTIVKICDYFGISTDDFINKKLEDIKEVAGSVLQEPAEEYPSIDSDTGKAMLAAINEHIDSKLEKTNELMYLLINKLLQKETVSEIKKELEKVQDLQMQKK